MRIWDTVASYFPGNLAVSLTMLLCGLTMAIVSLIKGVPPAAVGLLQGLGSAGFLAGFLGIINSAILAKEVAKAVGPTYEDWAFLLKMRKMGVRDLSNQRTELTNALIESLRKESNRFVITGASLRGLIGIGFEPNDADAITMRQAIVDALDRDVKVCVLMMHPSVAHHRGFQEQRESGHIERNILLNLMYFVKLRREREKAAQNLEVRLLNGIPSVFMACTDQLMLMNPYPTFGQGRLGYTSFSFLVANQSELYAQYLAIHFGEAWKSPDGTVTIPDDIDGARKVLTGLIVRGNEMAPADPIIGNADIREQLLNELGKM